MATVGAVYCVYDACELLKESVERIYPLVDKVLFLLNFKPWCGDTIDSAPQDTYKWILSFSDPDDKFEIVSQFWADEKDQRNAGLHILKNQDIDWCLIIDDDEFYNRFPLELKCQSVVSTHSFGQTKTLTDDTIFTGISGDTLILDPGGVNRNIVPTGEFYPYTEIKVVNTADAAETLTFDPTFTAAGNHDGDANADVLVDDNGAWVVDQLVSKTVTNSTDGSSGFITANTATTVTAILIDGTDNDWDVNDAYTIDNAGLNQAIAQNERGMFTYNGSAWVKIFVG